MLAGLLGARALVELAGADVAVGAMRGVGPASVTASTERVHALAAGWRMTHSSPQVTEAPSSARRRLT